MNGVAVVLPPAARLPYALAKAYLDRDARERALFGQLERTPRHFHLKLNHRGDDHFDPDTNTIAWDPYSALRTTGGGTQSPALGLGHEIAHAVENPQREAALAGVPRTRYDDAEEERVIRGSERHAARTLGESVRFDHRGSSYRVATPVSR